MPDDSQSDEDYLPDENHPTNEDQPPGDCQDEADNDCPDQDEIVPESAMKASFVKTYKGMDPNRQWVLASGTVVEQVLFRHYQDEKTESLAHSWIIDVHDISVRDLFGTEDWNEICQHIPEWPEHDRLMVESMMRFTDVCLAFSSFISVQVLIYAELSWKPPPTFVML